MQSVSATTNHAPAHVERRPWAWPAVPLLVFALVALTAGDPAASAGRAG